MGDSVNYARASATLSFNTDSDDDIARNFQVKFHFVKGAVFDSDPHVHLSHDEYLYVERGCIIATVDGITRLVTSADGEFSIPARTPHRWHLPTDSSEETVVWERTQPNDGQKELFFRTLINYLNQTKKPSMLSLYTIFAAFDNYPLLNAGYIDRLEIIPAYVYTKMLGWIGRLFGHAPAVLADSSIKTKREL